jgi:hypothetical protein
MAALRTNQLATAINRALASVAVFAQLLLWFAPLVEVHDGDAATWAFAVGVTTSQAVIFAGQPDRLPQHNPMTCPACIAQSLHAQLASSVRLPTVVAVPRASIDLRATLLPHHDPPSTHRSRAPPVVS